MQRITHNNINTEEHYSELFDKGNIITFNYNRALAVLHLLPDTGKVLDVGCWDGEYIKFWGERNACEFSGIDFSASAVEHAKVLNPGKQIDYMDLRSGIGLPDNTFNAVTCLQVLEHCDNPEMLIAEMIRVLVPGGRLIVSVPNELDIPCPEHLWSFYQSDVDMFPLKNVTVIRSGSRFENLIFIGQK